MNIQDICFFVGLALYTAALALPLIIQMYIWDRNDKRCYEQHRRDGCHGCLICNWVE